jgi:elongation factor Ts
MEITAEVIKALREQTNAGLMDCKRVLQETNCDLEAAVEILRERGHNILKKKENRLAEQGLVESYVHGGGKIGVLVEVNCETDFVANTPEFKELAHDLALQVAAARPRYIGTEELPEGDEVAEEVCLMEQPFVRDPQKRVKDLVAEVAAKVRENIRVRRFARFELGVDGVDA